MTAPPRISVIITAHNLAPYIGEAIESIVGQTERGWELIVVDDGSDDRTARVARRFERREIRVLEQPNSGAMSARRLGLGVATADLVVFLDGDDRLRPDALARFGDALDRTPSASVAYGDRILMDETGDVYGWKGGAFLAARPTGDVLPELLRRNFISTPGQVCIRASALDDAPQWPRGGEIMDDWYLWCRIAARCRFAYVGKGPLVEYRIRRNSLSRILAAAAPFGVDELSPTIEAVFALPAVRARFEPRRLAVLRRKCRASAFAFKGQELLRLERWDVARRYLMEAIRLDPVRPVDLLCVLLSLLGRFPPGARAVVGPISGRGNKPPAPSRCSESDTSRRAAR